MDFKSEMRELGTPPSLTAAARSTSNSILPDKFRGRYEFVYKS